ncbi:unnamed protein product [Symbiodinium microadriaticum]|nr:unnamed protein product [Symbiodinium microadriaticum]
MDAALNQHNATRWPLESDEPQRLKECCPEGDRRTPDRVASPSPGPTRRSGTVGIRSKLSDAEVAAIRRNLSPDYAGYKDRMHRRGAAAEDDMPQSIRHLGRPTVEDVIQMEEAAAAGDQSAVPKIPPASAPTFCGYWFCRRLPEGYLGARIPWEAQKERRRVAGWCTHPCTAVGCQYVAACRMLTSAGVGRCLRPVIIDNGADHFDHQCAVCAGLKIFEDIAGLQANADKALLRRRYPRRRRDAQADMALVPVTTTGGSTFGDFLKVVADAGGTAHLATFARLGVTNSPDSPAVRDSFPVLLDHGVPETVLLAILAPVPPQPPVPTLSQMRSDVPECRSSTRASMAAALEAMDPSRRAETMAAIDSNLLAQSTRRSMESRVRMLNTLAEKGNFQLFPLDAQKLQLLAGALRIGGYRSAGLYLDAALWHHLRSPVSADLRRAARSKAALRGLPGSRLKQAFDFADLATLVEHDVVAGSLDMDTLPHAVDVVVVSTWFMLREIEIAGARVKDVEITTATVSLDIPLHKTAQGGQLELTRRSFRCVCSTARQPLCPRCAADRHMRRLARSEPGAYLFPGAGGQQRTKLETAGLFNMVLSAAGWQTIYTDSAGHKRFVFGGHAARVAGATFLALRGVPVAIIQLIRKWSSTAVERYTQQAPLAVAPGIPAQALAAGSTQAQAVLGPPPGQQDQTAVDFNGVEDADLGESAADGFQDLFAALGFLTKKSKAQPPADEHIVQGVTFHIDETGVTLSPTPRRVEKVLAQLRRALHDDSLTPDDASTKAIYARAADTAAWSNDALSPGLAAALKTLVNILPTTRPRFVPFDAAQMDMAVLYADAFFTDGERRHKAGHVPDGMNPSPHQRAANGWGYVLRIGDRVFYDHGVVPPWFVKLFAARRAYIYMLEVFAQIIAFAKMMPPTIVAFIDNTAGQAALTKGYGKDAAVNGMISAFWTLAARRGWFVEFERVPSKANVADAATSLIWDGVAKLSN